MLDSQSAAFAERVWDVASQLGNNAPKIADDIMEAAFPLTCSQARAEGAMRMLRTGIISEGSGSCATGGTWSASRILPTAAMPLRPS